MAETGKELVLRRAVFSDAGMLFVWRNDLLTRCNSFRQEEISWTDHLVYMKHTLSDENAALYVAEVAGEAVGTCRAVRNYEDSEDYALSWTVAPEKRGQGWGTRMLKALVALLPQGAMFTAEVMEHNAASHRMAESAGLKREKAVNGVAHYRGVKTE